MAFVDNQDYDNVIDAPYIGRAEVEVVLAQEKKFPNGTPYLFLKTKILDAVPQESGLDGLEMEITQSLTAPAKSQNDGGKYCALKLRQMMTCFGLDPAMPLSEFVPEDIVGATGEVYIGMTKVKEGSKYPSKNEILDFHKPAPKAENSGDSWA